MKKLWCVLFGHRYIWVWNHIEWCRICGEEKIHKNGFAEGPVRQHKPSVAIAV